VRLVIGADGRAGNIGKRTLLSSPQLFSYKNPPMNMIPRQARGKHICTRYQGKEEKLKSRRFPQVMRMVGQKMQSQAGGCTRCWRWACCRGCRRGSRVCSHRG